MPQVTVCVYSSFWVIGPEMAATMRAQDAALLIDALGAGGKGCADNQDRD